MSTTDVKSLGLDFRYSANKARIMLNWAVSKEIKQGLSEWKSWYESDNQK